MGRISNLAVAIVATLHGRVSQVQQFSWECVGDPGYVRAFLPLLGLVLSNARSVHGPRQDWRRVADGIHVLSLNQWQGRA